MELTAFDDPQTMKSKMLPWLDEVMIVPVGDVQYGSQACDVPRFRRHIEWAAKQPNAYFIGMGDYVDFGSPSNRGRLRAMIEKGDLYDTVEDGLDGFAQEGLEELQDILAPTKGRWLGLVEGHHFWPFSDGTTTDTRLCQFLGAPFLGTCGLVNVRFKAPEGTRAHKPPGFTIWAHHGRGSGATQAAPLNKLERMAAHWDGVDVFLMAHHHKKVATKVQRLAPRWGLRNHELKHKNVILACTGGFLRGYMAGSKRGNTPRGGYVEAGMMTPVALGGVVILARPRWETSGLARVDLDISV